MKVLSFGTRGKYEEYLGQLTRSLDEYGLSYEVEVLPPHKKLMAALKKPRFILDRLDRQVLWLDADSYVTGPISLPEGEWDIGFLKHWGTHKAEVTCCAIAFNPTDRARAFLERWAGICERYEPKFSGTEHDRMLIVRDEMKGQFVETELTECLRGKLIVNYRVRKEHYV